MPRTRRTTCSRSGPTSTRASSTTATRRSASQILARQKELGLLPRRHRAVRRSTRTASPASTGPDGQPWPLLDTVRPWESLSDDEKRLFIRMAEVFAGYVEYTDDQVGRVIDFLEQSGELDNTIIVVVSDNGASGEGGPNGTFNEWRFFNGVPTPTELTLEHIDELGGPESYNHYNTGWAWAFDTPFPYWKRWAGYEGGIADMCLVSWPAKVAARHAVRATVRPRRRRRADDLRPDRHHPARHAQRARRSARSRARASRLPHRPDAHRASAPSSTRCSASGRSTRTAGWPAPCTRR